MANKKQVEEKKFDINDYKDEIDKYIKERVEIESASNMVKMYKKQLRDKSLISLIKSIIIILLLCVIVYGVIYLYRDGYFNKNNNQIPVINNDTKKEEEPKKETDDTKSIDELKEKYATLLDNIRIDSKCDYLKDYYDGKLSNELKEYIAFKNIDKEKIESDDESSYFEGSIMLDMIKSIFNETIKLSTFKYNGITYKYLESKDMFISNNIPTDGYSVIRDITDIKENDKQIEIEFVEGYINNNKLYNALTGKDISEYKANSNLQNYKNKLNTLKFTFENGILISIE